MSYYYTNIKANNIDESTFGYRISEALINNDYLTALNLYSNFLQSILKRILSINKNNSKVKEFVTYLINNETNIHTMIIYLIQYCKDISLYPRTSPSPLQSSLPTSISEITSVENIFTLINSEELSSRLYLSCHFNTFLMRIIKLNIDNIQKPLIDKDNLEIWKMIYYKIINEYPRYDIHSLSISSLWFQQLKLIYYLCEVSLNNVSGENSPPDYLIKYQTLNQENEILKENCNKYQEALDVAKSQVDQKDIFIEKYMDELLNIINKHKQVLKDDDDLAHIKTKLDELSSSLVVSLNQNKQQIEMNEKELREKYNELQRLNNDTKILLEAQFKKSQQLEEEKNKIQKLNDELQYIRSESEKANEMLRKNHEKDIASLQLRIKQNDSQNEKALQIRITHLEKEKETNEIRIMDLEKEIKYEKENNEMLREEKYNEKENYEKNINYYKEIIEKESQDLKVEKEKYQNHVNKLEKDIIKNKKRIAYLENIAKKYTNLTTEKERKCNEEYQNYIEEDRLSKERIAHLEDIAKKYTNLATENERKYNEEYQNYIDHINKLEKENRSSKERIAYLESITNENERKYHEEYQNYIDHINKLEKENRLSKEHIAYLESMAKEYTENERKCNEDYQNYIEQIKNQSIYISKINTDLNNVEKLNKNLYDENKKLVTSLENCEENIKEYDIMFKNNKDLKHMQQYLIDQLSYIKISLENIITKLPIQHNIVVKKEEKKEEEEKEKEKISIIINEIQIYLNMLKDIHFENYLQSLNQFFDDIKNKEISLNNLLIRLETILDIWKNM